MGHLTPAKAAALTYPTVLAFDPKQPPVNEDLNRPTGHVVAQVLSELKQAPAFKDMSWTEIMNGGFKITTTIDAGIQRALEGAANPSTPGSVMGGQPKNLQAAAVVVQPGTGRVLGYYGGNDGSGADFAGWHYDAGGEPIGFGAHPAGQTFFVYGLAAALKAGLSVKSQWNAKSPTTFPDGFTITNVGGQGKCQSCTLIQSTAGSLNVPFYGLTYQIGPANVLQMARDAGIDSIWSSKRDRVNLRGADINEVMNKYSFDAHVGIGQYAVTVVDQANAMATFAADGVRATAHFVAKVTDPQREESKQVIYAETLPIGSTQPVLPRSAIADLTWTLSRNSAAKLPDGPASAGMSGTWEYGAKAGDSADAWMIGYTRKLALAVWVGNQGKPQPLKDRLGASIIGGTLPASIYRTVMTAASVGAPGEAFDPPRFIGDAKGGNAPAPR
jgi:membrane peptidoglycan carboxypeptidase